MGIFCTIFAVYFVFLAFLVLIQRQLMYFPDKTRFTPAAFQLDRFTELTYAAADGTKLHGFYAPAKAPRKLTLVFFQGNAGNLGIRAEKIKLWREQGYGVMLATYRGFEGNEGSPTESGLYQDARSAVEAVQRRGVRIRDMIIYGESLGTGLAVETAAQMGTAAPPAGVILEVPYTSIPEVGAYRYPFVPIFWMLWDRYDSINKIQNIHAPILVLQAGKDRVIPPMFAKKLFDAAPPPKQILTNINADHMGIYSSPDIVKQIFGFINEVDKGMLTAVPAPAAPPPPAVAAPAPVAEPAVPSTPKKKSRR
ncbi:MAG: alpha/beta hydrolase [Alphaproteobacteria bacterium]|nr:alpha/beta hydrolase [Alphaproteobacteria bacterium]